MRRVWSALERRVLGILVLLACCPGALLAEPIREPLTSHPLDATEAWDYRLDDEGALWLAYYDDGQLRLRPPSGPERTVGTEGAGGGRSGLAIAALDGSAALLWRDKLPNKALFLGLTGTPVPPPLELGADTKPLARIAAQRNGEYLEVLWLGEQVVEGAAKPHHIYHRSVHLPSNELSPIERLFPGIYPVWASAEEGATLLAVTWFREEEPTSGRIVARLRPAGAKTFSQPVVVAPVAGVSSQFLRAARSGDRWLVFWVSRETLVASDFVLEGAYSDDAGATWRRFSFDELQGLALTSLQVATHESGHIVLAFSARRVDTDPWEKEAVYVLRSNDGGTSWSQATPLRSLADAGQFHARNPSVAFGSEPGSMFVVWEDWREIRSRLYASFSRDYGDTWLHQDLPLPHTPNGNVGLRSDVSAVFFEDDAFQVLAEQAVDDSFREKHLVRLRVTADDLARVSRAASSADERPIGERSSLVAVGSAEQLQAKLERRVAEFWSSMVGDDYAKSYTFYDPFFRSRVSPESFLATTGRIHYRDFEIAKTRVNGWRAEVETVVRAAVGPFRVPTTGEVVSQPEREVTMTEVWLWVDNDWYREFRSEAYGSGFTHY